MSNDSVVGEGDLGPLARDTVDESNSSQSSIVTDDEPRRPGRDGVSLGVRSLPDDLDDVFVDDANPLDERTGHDPVEVEIPIGSSGDAENAGVLVALGVEAVDDVVADNPGVVGDGVVGNEEEPGHEHQQQERERPSDYPTHGPEGTDGEHGLWSVLKRRRGLQLLAGVVGLLVLAVMAFTIFEPIQVLPRIRLAPGFIMADQAGTAITSEDLRGQVTLYNFAYASCGADCNEMNATMAEVQQRLDGVDLAGADFQMVTMTFDPTDTAEDLHAAAAAAGADGETWRWASAANHEAVVGAGFRIFFEEVNNGYLFDPVFIIVDGWGIIRGEYRYQTLVDDADRLVSHVTLLGEELRNSDGVATLAYEAAHLFLCYP